MPEGMLLLPAAAAVAVTVIAVFLFLTWPAGMPPAMREEFGRIKFAHRGLHDNKEVPENSMAAFRKAVEHGYGIEFDIRMTRDRKIVVFHDDSLKRMCGADKRVEELDFGQLSLPLLGTGEKIPALADLLALVDGKVPLLIEYKSSPFGVDVKDFCEKADELLTNYKGPYMIESFDCRVPEWFRRNRPEVLRGQLGKGIRRPAGGIRPAGTGIFPGRAGPAASTPSGAVKHAAASGKKPAAPSGKRRAAKLSVQIRIILSGLLLCNFRSRPHFVAYRYQDIGLMVELNRMLGAGVACWTVRDKETGEGMLARQRAIIFENYLA